MEIPVLVHGKGIYDSDDMKMKYTGMILEGSRIKEMGSFEELGPAYPGARVMDFSDCYILPARLTAGDIFRLPWAADAPCWAAAVSSMDFSAKMSKTLDISSAVLYIKNVKTF